MYAVCLQLSETAQEVAEEVETGSHTPTNEDTSSIELLTLFQRLLLCIIYSHIATNSGNGENGEMGRGEYNRGRRCLVRMERWGEVSIIEEGGV